MEYTIEKTGDINVISLNGSLLADIQSKEILDKVTDIIQQGRVNFVIDLKNLKFINSSGLGMLLTCLTKSRKAGGDVVLVNVPEQVDNLLVLTKLSSIFTKVGSVEEAVGKLKG